ncbi:MAG: CCA tRNA nucleotidyltransferase [Ruminococcaceae bacterium]|nr:CCA tRNA nucleotidyltransferase [Oscillospiraceae bacterium]
MHLPEYVRQCVDALERLGFACYAVGGCVRDSLLGLVPQDYDLCTDALPAQIKTAFADFQLVLAGEKHGTVGVITDGGVVEITTFRTEGDYADNRHPGWVKFEKSIEADLSRRDFTVNAMAYSPSRGFADPFGGQKDLENHILRAVGDADERFTEDALRILRGVRFAVRYHLKPEENTMQAMLSKAGLLDHIARERVFDELCKLLPLVAAKDLLNFGPILAQVITELKPTMGFEQHNRNHSYDVYTHICHVVEAVPRELSLRWAALLHDIGKPGTFFMGEDGQGHFYGHDRLSADMADEILRRLKAPNALREEVVFLIAHHMMRPEPDKKLLRRHLSKWGAQRLDKLLLLQRADLGSKGVPGKTLPFEEIRAVMDEIAAENSCLTVKDLAVNGHDLMDLGLSGQAVGNCLNTLLSRVLDEELPNEKSALIAEIRRMYL